MEIGSALTNGLNGFQSASNQISQETANINRQTLAQEQQPEVQQAQSVQQTQQARSLETSVVNLNNELNNAQANARSIETADEVLGSIIDIRV